MSIKRGDTVMSCSGKWLTAGLVLRVAADGTWADVRWWRDVCRRTSVADLAKPGDETWPPANIKWWIDGGLADQQEAPGD